VSSTPPVESRSAIILPRDQLADDSYAREMSKGAKERESCFSDVLSIGAG
jgi:hypothetical protein